MKTIAFINFVNVKTVPEIDIYKFITICYKKFTHTYILNGDNYKNMFIKKTCQVKNVDGDNPGLFFIKTIQNNIRCYSMLLNVNDYNNSTEDCKVHIDFKHINMDRNFNACQFKKDINFSLQNFFMKKGPLVKKSIVVIDLDDTIIDRDGNFIIYNFQKYFEILKRTFDLVVLWSHGCQQHVNHIFTTTLRDYKNSFDLIIVRNSSVQLANKGIGYILKLANIKFNVVEFTNSALIDDQACNYMNDYDYFIHVPKSVNAKLFNQRMWGMLYALQDQVTCNLNIES